MQGKVFESQQSANLWQKDLYGKGVIVGKWPNQWQDYGTVYARRNTSQYFVIINASDFDLLTESEIESLQTIENDWFIKPNL